jgi:hypothetical protein
MKVRRRWSRDTNPHAARPPFAVLGPASGFCCAFCGRGGPDMLRIMHRGHIGFWHRACAQE